jgi:hypothetical protein
MTTAIEMKPMKISYESRKGYRKGFYALMPSQSGGKPHKVYFFEPAKGMPCDFSCDCRGFQIRLKCAHCTGLHAYFSEIYERNDKLSDAFKAAAPVVETTPTPVVSTPTTDKEALAEEIDAFLAELEAEEPTSCPPAAHVASSDAESIYEDWVITGGRDALVIGRFSDEIEARKRWTELYLGRKHINLMLFAPKRLEKDPDVCERNERMLRYAVEEDGRRLSVPTTRGTLNGSQRGFSLMKSA